MVDDVVKQFSRKTVHPVAGISQQRLSKRAVQVVAVETLHVQRLAQHSCGHQLAQAQHGRIEKAGIAHRELASVAFRSRHDLRRLRAIKGKGFLHVDMAARGQGLQGQGRVRLGRRGDVDHVWPLPLQHLPKVVVVGRDGEAGG